VEAAPSRFRLLFAHDLRANTTRLGEGKNAFAFFRIMRWRAQSRADASGGLTSRDIE
jgi:hypothetical protein